MVRQSTLRSGLVRVWAMGQFFLLLTGCAALTTASPLPTATLLRYGDLPNQSINTVVATREITTSPTPISPTGPFSAQAEDTHIGVDDGPGSIAWSHQGDLLAYTHGFSLYVVPVGQWQKPSEVFSASLDDGPYDLSSLFVAWSPDDNAIGVTLEKPTNPHRLEGRMAQVDWRRGTFSLMAPDEEASLIDWSAANRIVAFRGVTGPWMFDVSTHQWQSLFRPETDQIGGIGFPRWSPNGDLVVGQTVDLLESSRRIAFYKVALDTNRWQPLNIGTVTFFADTGAPVPSPDGRWIAWVEGEATKEGGVWRIMLYDQKIDTLTEAINNSRDLTEMWKALVWSPDSRQLAFSAGRGGSYDRTIWILHLDALN